MPVIETFRASWTHTRSLTLDFIACVPQDRWAVSPHPRYATFAKQVRHLVCVQGVYVDGLERRVVDFGRKHEHYRGPLDRNSLEDALREKDAALEAALAGIGDVGDFSIDFYGTQSLASFLNVIGHHEAIHHGQWSFYAALGGFETPDSWKLTWGL